MKLQNIQLIKTGNLSFRLIFLFFNLNILINAQTYDPVLLDPGHGGNTGNTGSCGLIEDAFVTDISNEVYDQIYDDFDCPWEAYITRHENVVIADYNDRWRMANNTGGGWEDSHGYPIPQDGVELFVSIHANHDNGTAQGTEVFYYESSDQRARRSKNVSVLSLQYYLEETRSIFTNASTRGIKDDTQTYLGSIGVLRYTNMPAVLVETEFIDNFNNCGYFDQSYKDAGAEGIKEAICWTRADETAYVNLEMTGNITSGLNTVSSDETFLARNTTPLQTNNYYVENTGTDLYLEFGSFGVVDDYVRVEARNGGYISLAGGATIIIGEAGEIIPGFGSTVLDKGSEINFLGPGACIGIKEGGTYIVDKNVIRTFYNNGILAVFEDDATIQMNKGAELIISENGVFAFGANPTFVFQLPQPKIKIYGKVIIDDNVDLVLPAGVDITIYPGAEFVLGENASITIEGNFQAVGSSQEKITFTKSGTSNWGTVTFDGSSSASSILDNVVIEYGTGIRCLNGADVTVQNSNIENCTYGIYLYNSEPDILYNNINDVTQDAIFGEASGKSPLILGNTITRTTGTSYQGIYLLNNTDPFITYNDISGFQNGIYLGGGVTSFFSDDSYSTYYPNNRIRNSYNGLTVGWGSYVWAGNAEIDIGWGNSIDNNTYDVWVYQSSTLLAHYNYWGGGQPAQYVDGTSYLGTYPVMTSDPWGGEKFMNNKKEIVENLENPQGFDFENIRMGIALERSGNIQGAINHYKTMVGRNDFPDFALLRLASIRNRHTISTIRPYFETLSNVNSSYKPKLLNLLADIYLSENMYEEAMQFYSNVINSYPNSYAATNALFEKYFAALHYANDLTLASQLLSQLQSLNITDEDFLMRLEIAENMLNTSSGGLFKRGVAESENKESNLPKEYSLLGNYPNPFNPSTTISYALPYQSSVELVIYDIMGAIVKSFNIPSQSSGYQSILWDGTNENGSYVATGIYLYRINIKSLESDETFVKTAKIMMLK